MNDTTKLEKQLKEQAHQITSLKQVVTMLQRQLTLLSKKTNRAYETSRKNANNINTLEQTLRKR